MEYFRLRQHPDFMDAPVIPNLITRINRRYMTPQEAHRLPAISAFTLEGREQPDFIDVLDRQLFFVSAALLDVIKMYVPELTSKRVRLHHKTSKMQQLYHLPIFKPVACLGPGSVLSPDKRIVKHLVLQQDRIVEEPFFRVEQPWETIIIARQDAAESILRRNFRGVKFYRVATE
jgi:hypothetical protein